MDGKTYVSINYTFALMFINKETANYLRQLNIITTTTPTTITTSLLLSIAITINITVSMTII